MLRKDRVVASSRRNEASSVSFLQISARILEALLGVFSLYTAYSLFAQQPEGLAKQRAALHFPRWYWVLAGCVASIGGLGLIIGLFVPAVGALAAVWMVAYFIVATLTHLVRRDFGGFVVPVVFGLVFVGLMALRWSDLTPALSLIGR